MATMKSTAYIDANRTLANIHVFNITCVTYVYGKILPLLRRGIGQENINT